MLSLLIAGRALAPLMKICAMFSAAFVLCGCLYCLKCQLRQCSCVKYLLRVMGIDKFEDFELMLLVHQAVFEGSTEKMETCIRVTAGSHCVKTDYSNVGMFQQPLHISVEQGTEVVVIDLINRRQNVLGSLTLDVMSHILGVEGPLSEVTYNMSTKCKNIIKPRVKLTMVIDHDSDVEKGLLAPAGLNSDVDILVRQQLQKAKQEGTQRSSVAGEEMNELQVLKEACSGPLELFEGLGKSNAVYVAVLGPPESRRWILGIWKDKKDFMAKRPSIQEIDLLRVETVKGDPSRLHVFVINAYDATRTHKTFTFRRIDRARDVWVEILHLLVVQARAHKKARKDKAQTTALTGSKSPSFFAGLGSSRASTKSYGT